MMNNVRLFGRILTPPTMRVTKQGCCPVANFVVSHVRMYTTRDGVDRVTETEIPCVAWGTRVPFALEYKQDDDIYIEGRLQSMDDRSGRLQVVVDRVEREMPVPVEA